jgi:hypothetical protein
VVGGGVQAAGASLLLHPPPDRDVVRGWEIAHDALAEFLPDEADQIPATACWTPLGTITREQAPERFTRDALEGDLVLYRRSLDDFRRLHER